MSWGRLIGAAALGLLIFWRATAEPAPIAAGADPKVFASGRAMADIRRIAAEPHPVGSAANQRVRDYLVRRMAALGLSPRVQRDLSVVARDGGAGLDVAAVENVVGVLAGRDPKASALALMAHYDSAPGSPGAGDDATGVAAALETVRALPARGRPERDVAVVLTDGEEAGLLGAESFFARDPLARRIGTVINLEARGGGGRTVMFETSTHNGALIAALRRTATGTTTNSLANFVYQQMPYGTDLTPAMAAGKSGVNFAFAGRQFDYHAPTATPANLSEGAVQSMGAQALALAADLAFDREAATPRADLVYADMLGALILAYPPWAGWLALALAASLLAVAWRRSAEPVAMGGLVRGVAGGLFVLTGAALLLWLAREAAGAGPGYLAQRALAARFGLWEAAMALACAGWVMLAALLFGGREREASAWLGLLFLGLAVAAGLQIVLPLGAHIVAWPLTLAAASAAASRLGRAEGWLSSAVLVLAAAVSLGWIGGLFHLIALGLDAPPALALFAWLAGFSFWPLMPRAGKAGWIAAGAALSTAAGLVAVVRFTSPWSERHPQPTLAYYVADLSEGRFLRAAAAVGPSPWADALLRTEGGVSARVAVPPLFKSVPVSFAKPVTVPDPGLVLRQGEDGAVALQVAGRTDARALTLQIRSSAPVVDVRINGRSTLGLPVPGDWTTLSIQPSADPLSLTFRPRGAATVEARYALTLDHWPADAPPPPPRPKTAAAWAGSDALVLVGDLSLKAR